MLIIQVIYLNSWWIWLVRAARWYGCCTQHFVARQPLGRRVNERVLEIKRIWLNVVSVWLVEARWWFSFRVHHVARQPVSCPGNVNTHRQLRWLTVDFEAAVLYRVACRLDGRDGVGHDGGRRGGGQEAASSVSTSFCGHQDEVNDVMAERQATVAWTATRRRVQLWANVELDGVVTCLAEHNERKYESKAAETHDNRPDVTQTDNGRLLMSWRHTGRRSASHRGTSFDQIASTR